ncbi:hypothetical protein [Afifella sp. IM 167]|uniref:hypothetical protein n=1 Tax=Afifella sp. IM 167 TaxID=2033586 RepID=UPI001CC96C55|nr:hypothetical protein [Afifella sp. IM 167]MBZ8134078.1 hypothetical protein [Afifella sp. IM 167]
MKHLLLGAFLVTVPAEAMAQQTGMMHQPGMAHGSHEDPAPIEVTADVTEPGQGAFAAIQEIAGILAADESTDWSRVDLEALRQHLIDMNNVTLRASVTSEPTDGGRIFRIAGNGEVRDSILRMVAAHAATMNGVGGFIYEATPNTDGASLIAKAENPDDLEKLRGLGFIGLMTLGAHHQAHHIAIARGQGPHP